MVSTSKATPQCLVTTELKNYNSPLKAGMIKVLILLHLSINIHTKSLKYIESNCYKFEFYTRGCH